MAVKHKLLRAVWISVLLLFGSIELALANQNTTTSNFMVLSDIHFDPFIHCAADVKPCPLIDKLQHEPASRWSEILAADDGLIPDRAQDTNYPLWKKTLHAASYAAKEKKARFILVLGDFLGHDYNYKYSQYSSDKSTESYRAFVAKTFSYLFSELAKAAPGIDIYPVIGNNDTYQDDYVSTPNGAFFKQVTKLSARLINTPASRDQVQASLPFAGYYAVDLPNPKLRLLVLNTVLFAPQYQAPAVKQAAMEELRWLHQELNQAALRKQKVIIAMHIPPHIDVLPMLKSSNLTVLSFWKPKYETFFFAEIKRNANNVMLVLTAHLHTEHFRMVSLHQKRRTPFSATPAVSPLMGNNPAFKSYGYDKSTLQLEEGTTYYYNSTATPLWHQQLQTYQDH